MSTEEYKPTPKDIEDAENMMTPMQEQASRLRETDFDVLRNQAKLDQETFNEVCKTLNFDTGEVVGENKDRYRSVHHFSFSARGHKLSGIGFLKEDEGLYINQLSIDGDLVDDGIRDIESRYGVLVGGLIRHNPKQLVDNATLIARNREYAKEKEAVLNKIKDLMA